MSKISIRFFKDHEVRAIWDEEKSQWWFSIVDIVAAITESPRPRVYWGTVKSRQKAGHSQLYSRCIQLKLTSADGKKYATDCFAQEDIEWFGPESHPDFCGNPETGEYTGDNSTSPKGRSITEQQFKNRMLLRKAMLDHGFKPLDSEWWHFTLRDEPFPDTYFTFPVRQLHNCSCKCRKNVN